MATIYWPSVFILEVTQNVCRSQLVTAKWEKKLPFTEIIKARKIRLKIKHSTQGQTDATLLQKIYYWSHQFMPPWLVRDLPQEVRESSFTWHTTCDIPYFRCPAQNFSFSDISSPFSPLFLYFFHFLLVAVFSSLGCFSPQIENYLGTLFSGNCASDK